MGAQSTVRRTLGRAGGKARRLIPLAAALLLAALVAIPASNIALAQTPPDELTLVNADRDFVERKGGGEFVARPSSTGRSRASSTPSGTPTPATG